VQRRIGPPSLEQRMNKGMDRHCTSRAARLMLFCLEKCVLKECKLEINTVMNVVRKVGRE